MKKLTWRIQNQKGLASIVIVGVLVVLLTLVSLGFARLVERSTVNSTNRQLSSASTYAAQSGINDVIAYMKAYAQNPANASAPYVASPQCTGPNSLIGSASSHGPFYNDSNVSGDGNTKYDCILLNQTPTQLLYQNIPDLKSQVVKLTTSAIGGALDQFMFSWQPTGSATNSPNYPPSTMPLLDENTWNSDPDNYMPILRVSLYPVPASGTTTDIQKNSKTVYLYPQPVGTSTNVQHLAYSSLSNGQLLAVPCDQTSTATTGFTGTANYRCNMIVNQLTQSVTSSATDPINYVYARFTPIYGPLDVAIQADDLGGSQLKFIGDQAVVDITASVSNVSKRLQARVDISNETTSSKGIDDNVSAAINGIPEAGIRSADALCKQIIVHQGLYPYISFGDPTDGNSSSTICNNSGTVIPTPAPTLTFGISANSGADAGKPWLPLDSEAPNPDAGQSPVEKGTVYIASGGTATLSWNMADATDCEASGSDFSGNVLVSPYNTVTTYSRDHSSSVGSWTTPGLTLVQSYNIDCSGPGGTATRKTVTAWPPPTVTVTITPKDGSPGGSVQAGQPYTVNWSSQNATRCVLTGNWPDTSQTATSGSETVIWTQPESQNPAYFKSFTATCYDPINRPAADTKSVSGPNGPGGTNSAIKPFCTASVSTSGSTTSDATLGWSSNCDYYDAINPCEPDRYIVSSSPWGSGIPAPPAPYAVPGSAQGGPCWFGNSPAFRLTTPGTYCVQIEAWADNWTTKANADGAGTSGSGAANSGNVCITVYPPMVIDFNSNTGLWDQSPECSYPNPLSPYNWADNTWWCRNGRTPDTSGNPGCANSDHRWTTCDFWYQASGGSGNFACSLYTSYGSGSTFMSNTSSSGGEYKSDGPFSWINGGSPNPFFLKCTDNVTGQIQILAKTIP